MAIKYKNLKAEMIRKSVSNGKMAEVLGVTEQTFRRKLTGDVSVTIDEAQTLMQTLYENAECLIPQYKFNKQGEYNTILTDEMKHILLRFLLHQNKFNYGKAIKLTKEILRKQGYENLPCDLTFKRYAENFRKNNYAESLFQLS